MSTVDATARASTASAIGAAEGRPYGQATESKHVSELSEPDAQEGVRRRFRQGVPLTATVECFQGRGQRRITTNEVDRPGIERVIGIPRRPAVPRQRTRVSRVMPSPHPYPQAGAQGKPALTANPLNLHLPHNPAPASAGPIGTSPETPGAQLVIGTLTAR